MAPRRVGWTQTTFGVLCLNMLAVAFRTTAAEGWLDVQLEGLLLLQTRGEKSAGARNLLGYLQELEEKLASVGNSTWTGHRVDANNSEIPSIPVASHTVVQNGSSKRTFVEGFMQVNAESEQCLMHRSGKCVCPADSIEKPAEGAQLVYHQNCSAKDKSLPLRAIPAREGYYVLRHWSGKCIHPFGGAAQPRAASRLIYHSGCDKKNSALWFKPILANGDYFVLQHKSGMCLHPKSGGASPEDNVRLVYHHGCNTTDHALLFKGLRFFNPAEGLQKKAFLNVTVKTAESATVAVANALRDRGVSAEDCMIDKVKIKSRNGEQLDPSVPPAADQYPLTLSIPFTPTLRYL